MMNLNWIIFSYHDYHGRKGRSGHFSDILSENNRVLFVNPPLSILRRTKLSLQHEKINDRLDVITLPGGIPGRTNRFIFGINNMFWSLCLNKFIGKWRSDSKVAVLIQIPTAGILGLDIQHDVIIYDCHDNYLLIDGDNPRIIERIENTLLEKCDLLLASSKILLDRCYKSKKTVIEVPNGCNPAFWENLPEPNKKIKQIQSPRIMYYGGVNQCLDIEEITKAAKKIYSCSFVFIGEYDSKTKEELEKYPNIHLVGEVEYDDLPTWVSGADICMLPFKLNERNNSRDCLKLYEYLATGKPVIMPCLDQAERFKGMIHVYDKKNISFYDALINALSRLHTPEQCNSRKEAAERFSWRNNVSKMIEKTNIYLGLTIHGRNNLN